MRHLQDRRLQDLVEAGHDHDIGRIPLEGANEGFGVGVGGDLDRPPEMTGDAGDQVGWGKVCRNGRKTP